MATAPVESPPSSSWEHSALWTRVRDALPKIPAHFKSALNISGIQATEIFTFGATLGSTIEQEIVRTLNELRSEWDRDGKYNDYTFSRQNEAFPDVLFRHRQTKKIIFGIELKGWYLLAKEGEPSFRFRVDPEACAKPDLLVVVPWVLSSAIAGTPQIFQPYVKLARYVAEYRNFWWQHERKADSDTTIRRPQSPTPYPKSRDQFSDSPVNDKGNNFGRIARSEIPDFNSYIRGFDDVDLLGIKIREWRSFFKNRAGMTEDEENEPVWDEGPNNQKRL